MCLQGTGGATRPEGAGGVVRVALICAWHSTAQAKQSGAARWVALKCGRQTDVHHHVSCSFGL